MLCCRPHRICAVAAAEISGGKLTGAELKSQEMTFEPGNIRGGEYHFTTGSAGSTMLIAQTIVPILLQASEPSRVLLEGGTHAPGAPVFDFFDRIVIMRQSSPDVLHGALKLRLKHDRAEKLHERQQNGQDQRQRQSRLNRKASPRLITGKGAENSISL